VKKMAAEGVAWCSRSINAFMPSEDVSRSFPVNTSLKTTVI
jgi:hypothetical protein